MAEFVNTGQMPRVRIGNNHKKPAVNMTGGPFNGYRYRLAKLHTDKTEMTRLFSLQRIDIHMGKGDVNGSEHTINGKRFPMEVIIISMKFKNFVMFSAAITRVQF